MPSGAKKRKAAKKKKEQEATSHNQNHKQQPQSAVTHTHENDDLKHHDDKESEGEEGSSPASQDHASHQHQFADGEKEDVEKVEDRSHVQLSGEESKSIEEFNDNGGAGEEVFAEEGVVQIEKEQKPAGELNSENIIEEHVEARKGCGDGVLSQSVDEEKAVEIEKELKHFEKLHASAEHVEHQKESNDQVLSEGHNYEYRTNVIVNNSPFGCSTEAVNSLSESLIQVPNPVPVGEVYSSVVEACSDTVTDNVGLAGEKINIDSSIIGGCLSTSNVVQPGVDKNGKKEGDVLDQNDRCLPAFVDLELENKRDEAIVVAGDAQRASAVESTVTQETDGKLMLSYNAPKDEAANCEKASNGADHVKDSEVHESSDTQPLVASATRPVQRTSWMNCCGLFEVFSGSNR